MESNKHSLAEAREREFEDCISDRYHRDYHEAPIMSWHAKEFVRYAVSYIKSGDRILDLGCASGVLWELFYELLPEGVTLMGVDLSPKMVDIAAKKFPKGTFKVGSFFDIPVESGAFDVVIVSSALHHIADDSLPDALNEISRVMDEHGILIGREPLGKGRLVDKGGWLAGALMHLRHLAYRISHTREYPEPDPGSDHHAYEAKQFLAEIDKALTVVDVNFRNPVSLLLARSHDKKIVEIAKHLDEIIDHKGGQEIYYAAYRNYSTIEDIAQCISNAVDGNEISKIELSELMLNVLAAAKIIENKTSP